MGYSLLMENSQLLHLYCIVAGGGRGGFSSQAMNFCDAPAIPLSELLAYI